MDIVIKSQSDYHKLFQIIEEGYQGAPITIHLYHRFLEPMDILILTEFIIFQLNQKVEINLWVDNLDVKGYLEAIGLFEFCSSNYHEPTELKEIASYSAMPLRRVNRETMNYYIGRTQMYFQTLCDRKDLGMLDITLSELINNVYDHSNSPIDCFVFCQYYPQKGQIKLAVGDLGFGIPKTVNNYLSNKGADTVSPYDAVKWALKLNRTTQSMPHNAGRGLDTVCSFVKVNQGSWKLFSDNVKMIGNGNKNIFFENPINNFIGTVIEITIIVNNLEELETMDVLDW
ncbi:hypothetical protein SAMN04489724_0064 [Algoriphagus locisalis]|uniref:Uncharacterized protein n=1 Tax=Algoriphagus locisalis TaxID=305507 RepID=A0A1I7E4T9_9BACT|nr:hypothetical protein [Algoriphagus locisalis]SFU18925.1 hypothetical protein SAMN04489724_0064 [Algoriphagus locisalis]